MSSRVASKSPAHPVPHTATAALLIPALLLCISGAAALVYQVLWIKQLSLVVGVEVYAITTGISAFFAGLAVGGWLFGRWADRLAQPVLLYAGLATAVYAATSPIAFRTSVAYVPNASSLCTRATRVLSCTGDPRGTTSPTTRGPEHARHQH